jgi:hypothetical protein
MPDLQYVDSPDVLNSEILWRVIAPNYCHAASDSETSAIEISEGAFRTKDMSVFRASRITIEEVLRRFPPGSIVAAFPASLARDPPNPGAGCILVLDPDDTSHVLVCPKDNPPKRLTGSQANVFRRGVTLL